MSLVLFNCIADGRIVNGCDIEHIIESLTQKSIVPAEGSIRNTYYQSYLIKFAKQKELLKELNLINTIFSIDIDSTKDAVEIEHKLEDMISKSYCLDIKQAKVYFDFELLVGEPVEQDPDVLDTRFSSALRPFSVL